MIAAIVYILIAFVLIKVISIKDRIERLVGMGLTVTILAGVIIYQLFVMAELNIILMTLLVGVSAMYFHRHGKSDFK